MIFRIPPLTALAFIALASLHLHAQSTYIWDPSKSGTGSDATGETSGAPGTWNTSTPTLWSYAGADTTYPSGSAGLSVVAQFGGTFTSTTSSNYFVGVNTTVDAAGITFAQKNNNYYIEGLTGGSIVGPTGGTFQTTFSDSGGWLASNYSNLAFTGATTYQFDTAGSNTSGGMKLLGTTTFDGGSGATLTFGNSSNDTQALKTNATTGLVDSGDFELADSTGIGNGNSAVVNAGWTLMEDTGGGTGTPRSSNITLNAFGANKNMNNWGGALEVMNNTVLTGTITIQGDNVIGGWFLDNDGSGTLAGSITGTGNLWLFGQGAGDVAVGTGTTGALILGGTNNYVGNTVIFNNYRGQTVGVLGANAIELGSANALPTSTILVLGIQSGNAPIAGAYTATLSNSSVGAGGASLDGALDMHGYNATVAGLTTGSGNTDYAYDIVGNASNGTTSTLTINGTGSNTFQGTIADNFGNSGQLGKVALAVTGGSQTLTGTSNTYSGGTTVSGTGTLVVNNASGSATGAGPVTVSGTSSTVYGTLAGGAPGSAKNKNGGATSSVYNSGGTNYNTGADSSGYIVGAGGNGVFINSGGHLAPGNGGIGTITVGDLTLASGAVLDYEADGGLGGTNDFTAVNGALNLNSNITFNFDFTGTTNPMTSTGVYDLLSYGTLSGFNASDFVVGNAQSGLAYTFVNDTTDKLIQLDITTAATPEPSTWAMLLGGVALLGFVIRRRSFNS